MPVMITESSMKKFLLFGFVFLSFLTSMPVAAQGPLPKDKEIKQLREEVDELKQKVDQLDEAATKHETQLPEEVP